MFNSIRDKERFDSAQRVYDNMTPDSGEYDFKFNDDDLTETAITLIEQCELSSDAYEQLHNALKECDLIIQEATTKLIEIKKKEAERMKLEAEIEAGHRLI